MSIGLSSSDTELKLRRRVNLDSSCAFDRVGSTFGEKSDLFEYDKAGVLSFSGGQMVVKVGYRRSCLRTRLLEFGFSKPGLEPLRSSEEVWKAALWSPAVDDITTVWFGTGFFVGVLVGLPLVAFDSAALPCLPMITARSGNSSSLSSTSVAILKILPYLLVCIRCNGRVIFWHVYRGRVGSATIWHATTGLQSEHKPRQFPLAFDK